MSPIRMKTVSVSKARTNFPAAGKNAGKILKNTFGAIENPARAWGISVADAQGRECCREFEEPSPPRVRTGDEPQAGVMSARAGGNLPGTEARRRGR